jgi:hypothetical protein
MLDRPTSNIDHSHDHEIVNRLLKHNGCVTHTYQKIAKNDHDYFDLDEDSHDLFMSHNTLKPSVSAKIDRIAMITALAGGAIGLMIALSITIMTMIDTSLTLSKLGLIVIAHLMAAVVGAEIGGFLGEKVALLIATKNHAQARQRRRSRTS